MQRQITLGSAVATFASLCGLLAAPGASAAPAQVGHALPFAFASTSTIKSAVWSMNPVDGLIQDRSSGLSLRLKGAWLPSAGGVRFGGSGTPSIGLSDDLDALSPGRDDFAVVVTLTTNTVPASKNYSPNVIQKGYSGVGSQWKLQLRPSADGTKAECRFEGSKGTVLLRDRSGVRLDDSRSHVVGCWRDSGKLGVTVDGHDTLVKRVVGVIKPRTATSVANRKLTAGMEDQLQGSVNCIAVAIGSDSKSLALSQAGC